VPEPELTLTSELAKGQNDSKRAMVTSTHTGLDLNLKVPLAEASSYHDTGVAGLTLMTPKVTAEGKCAVC
jgi:hypothetical protein